nr:bioactive peptide P3=putative esophageal neuroregulator [Perinereis vancaurica, Peptide, 7 aa] [Perinereis vancaurica]
WMVGDVQ